MPDPLMDQGDQSGTSITTEQGVSWDQKYVFCTFKNTKRRRTIFFNFQQDHRKYPESAFCLDGVRFGDPSHVVNNEQRLEIFDEISVMTCWCGD